MHIRGTRELLHVAMKNKVVFDLLLAHVHVPFSWCATELRQRSTLFSLGKFKLIVPYSCKMIDLFLGALMPVVALVIVQIIVLVLMTSFKSILFPLVSHFYSRIKTLFFHRYTLL